MDIGTWWATVHGVTKSRTWLKQLSIHRRMLLGVFPTGSGTGEQEWIQFLRAALFVLDFMLDFANVVYIDLALSRFCSVKTSTKVDFKLLAVYWLAYKLPETLVVSCCESVWDCWSTPTHPRMELLLKRWGAEAGSREPSALFVWYTVTLDLSSWIGV